MICARRWRGDVMDALTAMKLLRAALETAHNGLKFYRDRCPDAVDGSDDEADAEIEAAIAASDAAIQQAERAEPVTLMDVTLDQAACDLLFTLLRPSTPEDGEEYNEVRLQFGGGHSGFGLYVSLAEYPEEGAELLVSSEPPTESMDRRAATARPAPAQADLSASGPPITEDDLRAMLPEPALIGGIGDYREHYTEQQMLAYGRAIVARCGGMK